MRIFCGYMAWSQMSVVEIILKLFLKCDVEGSDCMMGSWRSQEGPRRYEVRYEVKPRGIKSLEVQPDLNIIISMNAQYIKHKPTLLRTSSVPEPTYLSTFRISISQTSTFFTITITSTPAIILVVPGNLDLRFAVANPDQTSTVQYPTRQSK